MYADVQRLKACNETLVFDVNLFTKLPDTLTKTSIRACTADFIKDSKSKRDENASPEDPPVHEKHIKSAVRLVSKGSVDDSKWAEGVVSVSR